MSGWNCLGFAGGSEGKEFTCNARDLGLTPVSGRSPRKGNDYPFQYSCLENFMDRGAWRATVHGVTQLSNYHITTSEWVWWKLVCIWTGMISEIRKLVKNKLDSTEINNQKRLVEAGRVLKIRTHLKCAFKPPPACILTLKWVLASGFGEPSHSYFQWQATLGQISWYNE